MPITKKRHHLSLGKKAVSKCTQDTSRHIVFLAVPGILPLEFFHVWRILFKFKYFYDKINDANTIYHITLG